jgi:endonuclease V-like protein UPF0215 family
MSKGLKLCNMYLVIDDAEVEKQANDVVLVGTSMRSGRGKESQTDGEKLEGARLT